MESQNVAEGKYIYTFMMIYAFELPVYTHPGSFRVHGLPGSSFLSLFDQGQFLKMII